MLFLSAFAFSLCLFGESRGGAKYAGQTQSLDPCQPAVSWQHPGPGMRSCAGGFKSFAKSSKMIQLFSSLNFSKLFT